MENATKALIIAAGVLMGVLILSVAAYMFISFGSTSAEVNKKLEQDRTNQFNTQFTSYEGKEDITIYNVITIVNLANNNNYNYELSEEERGNKSSYYINVKLGNENIERGFNSNRSDDYNTYIKKDLENLNNGELPKYTCTVNISERTGRVYMVKFTKKQN